MTLAHIYTVAFEGMDAREVDVQVHIAPGVPAFSIVGLADKAVGESRERVRAALSAIGLALPASRITVNLAPADLPKEGSHYDLPIALALLASMGVLPPSEIEGYSALGELSLDGKITHVAGVLPAALAASEAKRGLICPKESGLEVSMVQSIAGTLKDGALSNVRPFRDPHHSASMAALIGGGLRVKPGEASLAHLGVLFLDELPEFARPVLDSLRQPLETGSAVIARANAHVRYPARFQLIAAMNPCRCGYLADLSQGCGRAPRCGVDYQSKLSGPLIDRIDIHVEVSSVSAADLSLPPPSEDSAIVAARVAGAREAQRERYESAGLRTNAEVEGELLDEVAKPDAEGQKLLIEATERMKLTARGYHRVLRVARTIADLNGDTAVARPHIAEALSYRRAAHS